MQTFLLFFSFSALCTMSKEVVFLPEMKERQSQIHSFKVAFSGLKILFQNERNFRIHCVFALLVIGAGIFFGISKAEWMIVLLLSGIVMAVEGLNTCVEYLCNLVSPNYHPLVKKIKDIAAGVVLLVAIVSVIIGCFIFLPYLMNYFV